MKGKKKIHIKIFFYLVLDIDQNVINFIWKRKLTKNEIILIEDSKFRKTQTKNVFMETRKYEKIDRFY